MTDAQWLRRLADQLDTAKRLGTPGDVPEGAQYIQLSHDLALAVSHNLRQIATRLEAV